MFAKCAEPRGVGRGSLALREGCWTRGRLDTIERIQETQLFLLVTGPILITSPFSDSTRVISGIVIDKEGRA
jgi:hypothetical protein